MTGVVGVVGAIATYKGAHDAQREAGRVQRNVQRESARAELVQTDRAELRSVLDHAEANLERAESATRIPYARWAALGHYLSFTSASVRKARSAADAVRFSEGQLELRLPADSHVTFAYSDARADIDSMVLAFGEKPTRDRVKQWETLLRRLLKNRFAFRTKASRLARSVLR